MTREAELELEIARLRDAFKKIHGFSMSQFSKPLDMAMECWHVSDYALSTPSSTTALQELITEVERRTIERCAEVAGWQQDGLSASVEIRELPTGNLKLEDL